MMARRLRSETIPAGIVAENQRRKIIFKEANTMTINNTRYSSYNYKRLAPFLEAVRELPEQYFTFTREGYEPLSIENLDYTFKGYPVWGMMHTYDMNGDTMRDPDMTFLVDFSTGNIIPHTFQQDNCPFTQYGTLYQEVWEDEGHWRPSLRAELDRFLKDWITNILDQGFKPEQATENEVTPEQFAEAATE